MTPETSYHPVLLEKNFQRAFALKKIHVIAPASGLPEGDMARLRELPFLHTLISEEILGAAVPYHANTDEARLSQLISALYHSAPGDIIWCLRGGYGSARLIDQLQHLPQPATEKIFIGYSDVTALHLFFSQQWGWRTIHGSGFSQLLTSTSDAENFTRLAQLIEEPSTPQSMLLNPLNSFAEGSALIQGQITGGNLTLVTHSIGTIWQIHTSQRILFLEEVGEKGYRIDRALTHLRQAKLLENVKAVVFGECLSQDEAVVKLALKRFADEVTFPVFQCNTFGHGLKNYPIVYQAESEIDGLELRIQVG